MRDAPSIDVMIEYFPFEKAGEYFIEIRVNREFWADLGPFETRKECLRASEDLMSMMLDFGAADLGAVH